MVKYMFPIFYAIVGLVAIIAGCINDDNILIGVGALWFILSKLDIIEQKI